MGELVRLTIEQGLARIVLARVEAHNAMSAPFIDALATACETAAADPAVRAVLLTAEGKHFSVGGDLRAIHSEADPAAAIEALATRLHDGIKALAACDAPLVVGVQGAAAGAGLGLAAAGDIVIAGEGASFTMAYSAIGLTSDGGATWLLPRVIGLRLTQEMALLNRRLSAAEALAHGLVSRVVADEAVEAEALAVARQLAAGPTRAFGGIKRLLSAGQTAGLSDQLDAEARSMGDLLRTQDAQGAIHAFLAREPAVFTGQ
ncbi:enoyl-CoA hydratase/isomerase family protein [Novosphingobium piscinae]|uniref:Enoyl-CoA hydratase/isomerase family protein n=1 Tax=Novosphingobium piscinae TaxID=1507448 RepID=A0A7X1FW18_9SPHN|nr:enoyl-CoA hydratase-related protein [Novosphingobium piscinae]MBC2667914.1 enoyl-CoA hydratase/isomerase family protein [Novosphingobium piscinae]